MFNRGPILFQWLTTVAAITPKRSVYSLSVSRICNVEFKRSTDPAAKTMKKHADELISDIGFGP
jgi:hypothetical protein